VEQDFRNVVADCVELASQVDRSLSYVMTWSTYFDWNSGFLFLEILNVLVDRLTGSSSHFLNMSMNDQTTR